MLQEWLVTINRAGSVAADWMVQTNFRIRR